MLSYLAASSICFVLSILPFFPPSLSPYYSPSLLLALFYFRLSLPLSPLFTISSSRPLLFPSFPPYLPIIPPLFFSFPFHFCFILPLLFPPSNCTTTTSHSSVLSSQVPATDVSIILSTEPIFATIFAAGDALLISHIS